METQATILHADLDAFYASVEQLLDPSLRGKPIAVGGGVVLAASYEAKAFGVRGGMSGRTARELCPELVFVGGHFSDYQRLGDAAIAILGDFTPLVERISIDEAFADVAGCTHLFGSPAEIAAAIRAARPRPSSVCRSRSAWRGPSTSPRSPRRSPSPTAWSWSIPRREIAFLHDLPVELMWGVGPVTRAKLAEPGHPHHRTARRRRRRPLARTPARPGAGREAPRARLEPRSAPDTPAAPGALGRRAVGARAAARDRARSFMPALRHLADRVASRLRAKALAGRTVTVRVRFADMRAVTRSVTLDAPISATTMLAEIAEDLVRAALADHPRETDRHAARHLGLASRQAVGAAARAAARAARREAAARHPPGRRALVGGPRDGRDPGALRPGGDRLRGRSRSTGGDRCRTRSGNSPRRTSAARSDGA